MSKDDNQDVYVPIIGRPRLNDGTNAKRRYLRNKWRMYAKKHNAKVKLLKEIQK